MAQSEDGIADNPDYPYAGSLAIIAPRIAGENQEISMTAFLRWNQEPFEGAGVWAFTRDQAEIMREEVRKLAEDQTIEADKKDYEALAGIHGTFIGTTGADGKLHHSFENSGVYLLAAVKRGYYPGFTRISIGTARKGLSLDAPQKAAVNETVTMTVTQRGTGDIVEGAGIWALTKEKAESLASEINALRESSEVAAADIDYEGMFEVYGEFLGRTDINGQLTHAFGQEGGYLLVTVKRGFLPARSGIRIGEPSFTALALDNPYRAFAGKEFTMTVTERRTSEPVQGAGIWAISREKTESLKADMTALREDADTDGQDKDYESLMDIYGECLGRTDESGQLTHAFDEKGGYVLVTVKKGYFPGWSVIRIVEEPDQDDIRSDVSSYRTSENVTGIRLNTQRLSSIETEITRY